MTELIINGKDAFTEWGIRMGDGFLDTLNGYFPMKEYITNNDRTQDGVQYVGTPKVNERSLTLNFTMEWKSHTNLTHPGKYFRPSKVKIMRPTSPK